MAITNQKVHQSPGFSLPSFRMKTPSSFSWGTGGNTATVTDPYCFPNSQIDWWITGTTPQAGQWAIQINEGSFTITSSDSESSSLTVSYIIC